MQQNVSSHEHSSDSVAAKSFRKQLIADQVRSER